MWLGARCEPTRRGIAVRSDYILEVHDSDIAIAQHVQREIATVFVIRKVASNREHTRTIKRGRHGCCLRANNLQPAHLPKQTKEDLVNDEEEQQGK